jgi:hypothetical protein
MRTYSFRRLVAAILTVCMVGQPLVAAAATYEYQVPMTGMDTAPMEAGRLTFTPTSHDFGTLVLGSAAVTTATLRNSGQEAVEVTGMSVSAPYSETNNCPSTLVGGQSCTVTVRFTPSNVGTFAAPLVVNTVEAGAQISLSLSGKAVAQTSSLTLSVNSVDFGSAEQGIAATPKDIIVTNSGNSPARVNGVAISAGMADFNQSNNCGASLAPGATCTISLSFVPGVYGARAGSLNVYEAASETLYSVALTGFGDDAILAISPGSLALPSAIAAYASSTGQVTVTNQGNIAMAGLSFDTGSSTEFSVLSKTCAASLPAGASCNVTIQFAPEAAGPRTGTLSAFTTNAGSANVSLSGTGIAQAGAATVSVSSLDFENIAVDASSSEKSVTVTNTGNVSLTVSGVSIFTGGEHFTRSTTCGATLAVNAACTINVTFSPKAEGVAAGSLRVALSTGNLDVALSGTGTLGTATPNPTALTFADQQVASSSPVRNVMVTNTGNRKLTFTSVGLANGASDFGQTNNCVSLEPEASCVVSVTFTPTATGSRSGSVAMVHDGVGGTTLVDVGGSGRAQGGALTNPTFPTTPVGSTSTATATLSNTGIGALTLTVPSSGSVTGSGYSFVSSTCGTSIAVGASCAVTIQFAPTSTAASTGTLTIATGAGSQSSSFGSTGIQGFASVSPSSLTFAVQQTITTSPAQTVTVTNTGTNTLSFSGVGISDGDSDYAQSNNCGSVPVNGTCTVSVSFTPSTWGTRTGTLSFAHNGGGLATVALSGTGQGRSATLSDPTFSTTQVGSSSTAVSTFTNTGVGSITVTAPTAASVTGTDFAFVSTTCGSTLAAGGSCTTTVRFAPTATTARTGSLDINSGAGPKSAALSATAIQGNVSLSADSLTFATKQVGEAAAAQTVTVTNNGTAPLTFTSVSVSAGNTDFSQTSPACTTLAVNATCSVIVTFTPSTTGPRGGAITLAHNGTGPTTFSVSGSGQGASATLSTPGFGSIQVGANGTAAATLTNTGIGAVTLTVPSAASVTGTDFSFVSTTCGATLAAGASCTATVRFAPTSTAARTGSLAVATSAGSKTSTLSATGVQGAATLSAASLTFASKQIGDSATAQTITVTNQGTAALVFTSVAVTAGATDFTQASPACTTLAVNGTCVITVNFMPTASGTRPGTITLAHNGTGATSISLTGTGQTQAATLSTPSFPATAVGSTSTATATMTNTGIGALSLTIPTAASVTGAGYTFVSTTCATSLAVSGTCSTTVRFSPTSTTAASGSLAISTGAGTKTATLGSTGIQGFASVSPSSLTFAAQQNGTTSATQVVTVTNTGTNTLTFTGVGISAGGTDFAQSNGCGAVAVNGTCTVNVTFTPSAAGPLTGTLSFTHNGGGVANVSLSGTGQAASASLSTPDFGTTQVGSNSNAVATLTNTGLAAISVTVPTAASVTGTDFSFVSTTCGATLAAGGTCATTVRFAPTAVTPRSGSLTFATGAGQMTASMAETATRGNASLTSTSLTFAATQIGVAASAQTVTVTNNGTAPLVFTDISVSAGATDFTEAAPACTTLAVNATCVITVNFTPTAAGARPGTITLNHNGNGSSSISLTGTGQAQSATLSTPAFSTSIPVGSNGTAVSTLTNTGIGAITLTAPTAASVTGTDFTFVSTTCGTSLPAAGTCSTTVRFSPTAAAARTGTLSLVTSAGTKSASLAATGVQGISSLSSASLTFAAKQVGDSAATQAVTVTNTGTTSLVFTSVSVTAGATDFAQTSSACTTLAVNGTCTITVSFTPTAAGARPGTITLAHNGTGSTSISLTGTGQGQTAILSTPSFPATAVGATSTATATLTNTGLGVLSTTAPTAASVTGAGYTFVSTTCTTSLAVSGTCTTTVRFSPTSTTAASGSLAIATGAGTKSVSLGSTGIQGFASVSPSSLTFATYQNGVTSPVQVVTVTNTGTNTLTFTGVGISAGATDFAQSNNCGAVAVNGTCTVNVTFTPSAAGSRPGTLSFTHNGGGIATVSLTGTGQVASATLSDASFATTQVGSNSTAVSTLTNTGIGSITVTAPTAASVTGTDFTFVSTTCATSLAANGTCTTTVRFSPTATTARTGSLAIVTGAGTITEALAATAVQGNASLSATSRTFATTQIGSPAAAQTVTVTNNGTAPLVFTNVSVSAGATDFTEVAPACTTLAVSGTCVITVNFTPTAAGTRTGTVTLAHNGTGSTTISLSGTGQAQGASLSTPAFPATAVGATSTATATLTNTGVGVLSVTAPAAASVTGAAYTFVSTTCGTSLAAAATCTVTVRFSPTSTTAASGSLAVATGAGTQTVTLGSTGIQGFASVNPSSLTFPTTGMGATSAVQTVTVTNTGTNTLTFTGVGISAGATDFAQSNNCGSVAVNGTCTVSVSMTPSASGTRPGTLSFTHNGGGIANVSLTGTGQLPSGTLSMGVFPATAVGSSSTAVATYSNTGTGPMPTGIPTSASVTGAAYSFVSTTCTGTVPVSGSCTTTVRFSPTTASAVTGNFAINDYNQWHNAALSNTGVAAPTVPTASFSPATVTSGSASTFTWTTSGANSASVACVAPASGSGSGTSGSITVTSSGIGTGSCTVTATNTVSGNATRAANLVVVAAPAVTSRTFSPATVTTGTSSTFTWATSGATGATVACSAPASGSGSGTSGSIAVSTSGTGTGSCTVTATNAAGTNAVGSTNLVVVAAPSVATASFSPTSVTAGSTSTFSWTTSNATSASVACSAPASGSGTGVSGSITVSTTAAGTGSCTVTAANAAGSSAAGGANLTVTPAYTYGWQTGAYTTPAACGSTTATRSVWCQRSDGTTVADSFCGAGKPATTLATTDYSSCTYSFQYSGWSTPAACGATTQTRTATCKRSDGTTVANSFCGTPVTSQATTDYSSCTYSYTYGGWSTPSGCGTVTQTRTATCKRSDGTTVANSFCGAATTSQSATNYDSCTYSANLGGWSACSNTCGTGTQTRSVSCTRSDSTTVANSYCGSPATSQSCTGNTGCTPPPIRLTYCTCQVSGNPYDYGMEECVASGDSPAGNGYPAWSGNAYSGLQWGSWDATSCTEALYTERSASGQGF